MRSRLPLLCIVLPSLVVLAACAHTSANGDGGELSLIDSGQPPDAGARDAGSRDAGGPASDAGVGAGFLRHDGPVPTVRAFYVGHSLVSDVPDVPLAVINRLRANAFSFKEQFVPGAPLRWHWDNCGPNGSHPFVSENDFQENVYPALASGSYTHLIVTDSVPRGGQEEQDETVKYLGQMLVAARAARPDIRVFYYETWHDVHSGTSRASRHDIYSPRRNLRWRPRLEADGPMWQAIVDRVNAAHPPGPQGHPVKLIPAGRILGRFVDSIDAGRVPGMKDVHALFSDEIHLNNYGKYLVGLVHASVMTLRHPSGMPADIISRWGGAFFGARHWDGRTYAPMSPAAVAEMHRVVADGLHELYVP